MVTQLLSSDDNGTVSESFLYPPFTMVDLVLVTTIWSVNAILAIAVDIYLITRRNSKSARKRDISCIILSNLGAIIYMSQHICFLFVDAVEFDEAYLIYLIGFSAMYVPTLVRAWKIVCCFYRTWDWKLLRFRDPLLDPIIKRDQRWLWLRIIILSAPFYISFPFLLFFSAVADYAILPYQALLLLMQLILAIIHWRIRKQLDPFELNQSNNIIFYSLCTFLFFIFDNVAWYYGWEENGLIIETTYTYIAVFLFMTWAGTLPHLPAFIREHRDPPEVQQPRHIRSSSISTSQRFRKASNNNNTQNGSQIELSDSIQIVQSSAENVSSTATTATTDITADNNAANTV